MKKAIIVVLLICCSCTTVVGLYNKGKQSYEEYALDNDYKGKKTCLR